jgi:L-malate glycosyltransferase
LRAVNSLMQCGSGDHDCGAHLLHVFGTFDHGGAEGRTIRLIAQLGRGLKHRLLVGEPTAMGARPACETLGNVTFDDVASTVVLGRPGLSRLRELAKSMRGYDLILTYGWGGMDAVAAHRMFSRSFGLASLIHHEDGFSEKDGPLRAQYRHFALQTCHTLVVPSRTLEKIALSRWKVPQGRILRIPNGVDVRACQDIAKRRDFPGLEAERRFVVGTVAGLRPEKNLPRLVRAVSNAGPNIVLAIAGEGGERAAIVAEAERCKISDRVLLPGFLAEPHRYFGSFGLFAMASDTEQYPIALAEAMAAGLAIVSTDVGDIAEMVSSPNRSLLVPSADEVGLAAAINELANDKALRQRVGRANAEKAASQFGESAMIASFRDLYFSAIGET